MEIALALVVGTLCIVCFFIGTLLGQKVRRGEDIRAPSLNPMKAFREREDRKQAEAEQIRIETLMRNIENYDGTARGQEDV